MVPVEAVARGYLAGSGPARLRGHRRGVRQPAAGRAARRRPAARADLHAGHQGRARRARRERVVTTRSSRRSATRPRASCANSRWRSTPGPAQIAADRGIILADTKFEFGRDAGRHDLVLGDEVLTPDSSRFWPADQWEPGHAQPSFDKQYVRDWLLSPASGWDRAVGQAAAAAARGRRGADPGAVRRGLRAADRARASPTGFRLTSAGTVAGASMQSSPKCLATFSPIAVSAARSSSSSRSIRCERTDSTWPGAAARERVPAEVGQHHVGGAQVFGALGAGDQTALLHAGDVVREPARRPLHAGREFGQPAAVIRRLRTATRAPGNRASTARIHGRVRGRRRRRRSSVMRRYARQARCWS